LVAHVLHTLPDSLARREELLHCPGRQFLPPGEENAVRVRALQFHLQEHQRLRFDWPAPNRISPEAPENVAGQFCPGRAR
jgi:hypothetical protein